MKNPVGNADADAPFRGNPAFVVALERALPAPVLSEICAQLHEDVLALALSHLSGETATIVDVTTTLRAAATAKARQRRAAGRA